MMRAEADNPWTILGSKPVYDNPWINVTEFDVINPGGGKGIYGKVHFKNLAIAIVPLTEEGELYLVGQYRFTLNAYSWELPEGGCPEGTDPLEAARRELKEETGLVAKRWTELFNMHLSNSVSDEYAYAYLARDLEQQDAAPEESEELRVRKVHLDTALEMVERGAITDALSVAAIYKIKYMMLDGKL